MSINDWGWNFAGEWGRDEMLREEIAGQMAASARQASRMRSQLAKVQGSLEARITALSTAFDAYVELGDLREQLMEFGDSRLLRRDAAAAIETLAAGATPEPLDATRYDAPYWLLDAVNAVIAVASGSRDHDLEARAASRHSGAATFVVACSMALGHGDRVGDLISAALIGDGSFNRYQLAIVDGVADGLCGAEGMASVRPAVEPTLQRTDANAWLAAAPRPDDAARLSWLEKLAGIEDGSDDGSDATPPASGWAASEGKSGEPSAPDDPATRLRGLVVTMIGEGAPDEAALLRRAAQLRQQIENPQTRRRTTGEDPEEAPTSVLVWIADLLDDPDPRRQDAVQQVRTWLRPSVAEAVRTMPDAIARPPLSLTVQHRGWSVPVTDDGPDQVRIAALRRTIGVGTTTWTSQIIGMLVVGGLIALVGILVALASPLAGIVVAVIGVLVGGGGLLLRQRRRRELTEADAQRDRALTEAADTASERLDSVLADRAAADTRYRERRNRILTAVTGPADPTPEPAPRHARS